MFKHLWKTGVYLFALVLALSGCIPSGPDYISDYDVVYTNYDKNFDFSAVHTYLLPDSVVYADSGGTAPDHKFDQEILTTIESNLNALGWTRLSNDGGVKADVVVLATASQVTYGSCAVYCWYCYWGWYPGWGYYPPAWGPGWGWGYPADMICTSYNAGTLTVSITEPNQPKNETLPVAWVGILNGLLEGSDANISSRITTSINQMFIQSPYLKP
jgi:hypothetical protein